MSVNVMGIYRQTVIASLLWMALMPAVVLGAECFENSPSKNRGSPLTADIDLKDIIGEEYDALSQLINNMAGFWNGAATEITCKGTMAAPIEEQNEYKIRAHATKKYLPVEDALALQFKSTWEGKTRNTSKPENFQLFLTRRRLRLNRNIPGGDIETIKIADNFLVFYKKTNVRSPSGGVVAQEIVRSYLLTHNSLSIEYLAYSNGRLVSKSLWKLNH